MTVLGQTVRHSVDFLEVFDAPDHAGRITFECAEVASMCPVTEQPDLSTVRIEYQPGHHCIESKSLKLYLWGFRNRGLFAEAMAAEIADRVFKDCKPMWVEVSVAQAIRGGIATTTTARR